MAGGGDPRWSGITLVVTSEGRHPAELRSRLGRVTASCAVYRRAALRTVFALVALVSLVGMHGLDPWTLPTGAAATATGTPAAISQPGTSGPGAGVRSQATPSGADAVPATPTSMPMADGCPCPPSGDDAGMPGGATPTHSGHLAGMCVADGVGGQAAPAPAGLVDVLGCANPPPRPALPTVGAATDHPAATSLTELRILRI